VGSFSLSARWRSSSWACPRVRWFLALSLPVGIGVGVILHLAHRD